MICLIAAMPYFFVGFLINFKCCTKEKKKKKESLKNYNTSGIVIYLFIFFRETIFCPHKL